ncbi:sensor histidine kinase [Hyphomonas sp. FCG-A18]|uniref:sensor histidine kinase n=1 Tax=Hyphomonas sp. FCG-A18 TaxID=3080019 RepID=UPI002B302E40|nr:sensor histidine kinase [Hyphomonas sp. FCG-A18]
MSESSPTLRERFGRLSLARRLLIGALLWSLIVVAGGVVTITAVYRAEAINLLDDELDTTLITLSRAVDPLDDGTGRVQDIEDKRPPDPRFETPLSGRYWAIIATDENGNPGADIRSRSVWDGNIPISEPLARAALAQPGLIVRGTEQGPAEEPVRVALQALIFPDRATPILFMASADISASNEGANRLGTILVVAMLTLAGGTLVAMALALRLALRPLDRVQADITDVRAGRLASLTGDYPSEVQPLTEELNKLLEHNRSVVDRARTHVGNLAHALKTPLAVLRNEATGKEQLDDVVRRQTLHMQTNVEHYLKRAQAAARAETLNARTPLEPSVERLVRTFSKLFGHEGKTISAQNIPSVHLRIEQQDLEEMLGNLMENACKWAKSRIDVSARSGENGLMEIYIDDDGPGLPLEQREKAIKRGVRLDETAPGTGLGLSIVADIADMNSGRLTLSDSPIGGLRATISLRQVA